MLKAQLSKKASEDIQRLAGNRRMLVSQYRIINPDLIVITLIGHYE